MIYLLLALFLVTLAGVYWFAWLDGWDAGYDTCDMEWRDEDGTG